MRRLVLAVICILAITCLALPSSARAWGRLGHEVVAEIASRELTEDTRATVRELLNGQGMVAAAAWADEVRDERPETRRWHYVYIPLQVRGFDREFNCPENDCLIAALERQIAILGDRSRSRAARGEALRFVIHLMGDLHQPLDVGDDGERASHALRVRWFGRPSDLHQVWETGILTQAWRANAELVSDLARVARDTPAHERRSMQSGTLIDWANEAHVLAGSVAYALPADRDLAEPYYERAAPVVGFQLVRGGLRLGRVLNDTLGDDRDEATVTNGANAR